ncbi:MAG TPA: 3-keto-5-aminohexanoate cleavage protein [Stellaceae bacterium]|nr:3-keto-5-aminohexanoate cleavage protein [Stellaceae bacterium]
MAEGADALHVHPRDGAGRESVHPDDTAAALGAIRASVPGIPVGVSTGWWTAPGGRERQAPIATWRVLPDYVSVNLIEEDAPEIIALALKKGVGVEAGLWSIRDAERFAALEDAPRCLRTLIEINEQDVAEATTVARGILGILHGAGLRLPCMLHGFEATKWPLDREAIRLELDTRIGLEDGKKLPTGAVAEGNAALIRAARDLRRVVSK